MHNSASRANRLRAHASVRTAVFYGATLDSHSAATLAHRRPTVLAGRPFAILARLLYATLAGGRPCYAWATKHPSRPDSPRPVRNEGGVNNEVHGGARVSGNYGMKQRGVIKVDAGVDRSQVQVQRSTATAGSSRADDDGRRSGGGLSATTHMSAGRIAPTYGYFKFSPYRITVTPLQGRRDLITWRESIEPQLEVARLKGFADGTVPIPPVDDVGLRGEFRAAHLLTFMVILRKPGGGGSGSGLSTKDVNDKRSTQDKGHGGGVRRRECWICHDPDHLSYECLDRDDSDEDDTKGGRSQSTSRHSHRDAKPRKEKQTLRKMSSTKDVDTSNGKSRDNREASCSMVGVVVPTVSLVPEAGKDFQAVAAAVQANPMAVLLDSGCSHHLMGTKAVFVDMAPSDGVKHVRGFNGALHPIEGRGTVALQGEAGKRVLIPDVLYVPSVQANLLSGGQLKESGKWLVLVERQAKKSVLMLRSDRGGEFLGKEFTDFVNDKGIVHDLTCPHTTQQNGMAKREMRTGVESVRTMLLHMGVQHHWWHLTLRQAVWVRNCLERSTTPPGTTPYQLLTGKKPDLTLVRVWGCMVQFMVPEQQRGGKLAPKARWGLHLGVSPESKGWEVLDLTDNKVVTSVMVIFYETLSLEVWKAKFGPMSVQTRAHPPTDTTTATVPLLAKVDEPADEDIVEVLPPSPVLAPPFPVANRLASTPVSATSDEGSLEASPVAPASGIAGADTAAGVQSIGEQQMGLSKGELSKSAGGKQQVNDLAVDKEGEWSAGEESTDSDVVEVPITKPELRRTGRARRPSERLSFHACLPVYDEVDNDLLYDDAEEDEELLELDLDMHADPEHRWDIATMTVKEAMASWKGEVVKAAMEEEIRSLIGMGTWELV
ncbi:unnamed protein product [Closterium sp. NIES-53]